VAQGPLKLHSKPRNSVDQATAPKLKLYDSGGVGFDMKEFRWIDFGKTPTALTQLEDLNRNTRSIVHLQKRHPYTPPQTETVA
jgi:hypothetical protein